MWMYKVLQQAKDYVALCHFFFRSKKPAYFSYTAGILSPAVRALIGYFEVTWRLTIKLFPAKTSERETLQNLWRPQGNSALFPANVA